MADHSSVILDEDDDVSSLASDIDERNNNTSRFRHEEKRLDKGAQRTSIMSKVSSIGREPRTSSVTNFNSQKMSRGAS